MASRYHPLLCACLSVATGSCVSGDEWIRGMVLEAEVDTATVHHIGFVPFHPDAGVFYRTISFSGENATLRLTDDGGPQDPRTGVYFDSIEGRITIGGAEDQTLKLPTSYQFGWSGYDIMAEATLANPINTAEITTGRIETDTVVRRVMSHVIDGDRVEALLQGSSIAANALATHPSLVFSHFGAAFPLAGTPDAISGENKMTILFPGTQWYNPGFSDGGNDHAGSANSRSTNLPDRFRSGHLKVISPTEAFGSFYPDEYPEDEARSPTVHQRYTLAAALSDVDTFEEAMARVSWASEVLWDANGLAFDSLYSEATPAPAGGGRRVASRRCRIRISTAGACGTGSFLTRLIFSREIDGQSAGQVTLEAGISILEPLEGAAAFVEFPVEKGVVYSLQAIWLKHSQDCASCGSDTAVPGFGPGLSRNGIGLDLLVDRAADGTRASYLSLDVDSLGGDIFQPDALKLMSHAESDLNVIRESGAVRQIESPGGFVDIVSTGEKSFRIAFFPVEAAKGKDGDGLYTFEGAPSVEWSIADPEIDPDEVRHLRIVRSSGGKSVVALYAEDTLTGGVTLTEGNGLRVTERMPLESVSGEKRRLVTLRTPAGAVVSRTEERFRSSEVGWALVETVDDPGGRSLHTISDRLSEPDRLVALDQSEGSHLTEAVDPATGRLLESREDFGADVYRVTRYTYDAIDDVDGDGLGERLTAIRSEFHGNSEDVERPLRPLTYRLHLSRQIMWGEDLLRETWLIAAAAPDAPWDAPDNLVKRERRIVGGWFAGRNAWTLRPDGVLTLTRFEQNTETGDITTIRETGAPSEDLQSVIRGRRRETTRSRIGEAVMDRVVDIESGLLIAETAATAFDTVGRVTVLRFPDGSTERRIYSECCGQLIEKIHRGLHTHFEYDDLGREVREWTTRSDGEVIGGTGRRYDEADRVVEVLAIGREFEEKVVRSIRYDLTGFATQESDGEGRTTRFEEIFPDMEVVGPEGGSVSASRITKVLRPDGGTEVRSRANGGTLVGVSGTAVADRVHTFGSMSADESPFGVATTWRRISWSGSEESQTTHFNDLGQTLGVVHADGSFNRRAYNKRGQLVKKVDRDGVVELIGYDDLGRPMDFAVDMDRNGIIDPDGSDRLTRKISDVVLAHDQIVERVRIFVWERDGVDASREVARVETGVDGLHEWSSVNGLTRIRKTTYSADGTRSDVLTHPDGSRQISLSLFGRLLSVEVRSDADLLSRRIFLYDAFGRVEGVTDARGGVSAYTYYDDDQIRSVTTPDPDASEEGEGRDPLVFRFAYDAAGRRSSVASPDGTVTLTSYEPHGGIRRRSGGRATPVEYDYDGLGRIRSLTTWTDFSSDAGRALTEWHFDPLTGRLNGKTHAGEEGPRYDYSPAGRVLRRTWARRADGDALTTTYRYGPAGDLTGIDYSDETPDVEMTFDRAGRLLATTDATGTRTESYGSDGLLGRRSYSGGGSLSGLGVAWAYDALDRPIRVSALIAGQSVQDVVTGYGSASRLKQVGLDAAAAVYAYEAFSDRVRAIRFLSDGAGRWTTSRIHDRLDRTLSITGAPADGIAVSRLFHFDNAGRRIGVDLGDGRTWSYAYDDGGQLVSAVNRGPDGQALGGRSFGYAYDSVGNRTVTRLSDWEGEGISNLGNQLEKRDVPGFVDVTGVASQAATVTVNGAFADRQTGLFHLRVPADNSEGAVRVPIDITAVVPDAKDGLDAVVTQERYPVLPSSPEVFAYDADGNLVADGRRVYEWDGENRLVAVETHGSLVAAGAARLRVEYRYDVGNRVTSRRVLLPGDGGWRLDAYSIFLYDGSRLLAEFNAMGDPVLLRSYAWGLDVSGTSGGAGGVGGLLMTRVHGGPRTGIYGVEMDDRGNVGRIIDLRDGASVVRREYGPFGEPLRGFASLDDFPFAFSSKRTDPLTHLVDFGFRHFDPTTGQWLSRDPIEEAGGYNQYGFSGNNPIGWIDVDGLATYAIDGTWVDVRRPDSPWTSTNVSDFIQRLDRAELGRYYGGPGSTPGTARRGGRVFNGTTGWETYRIVQRVMRDICRDRRDALQAGVPFTVNLVGWSRGATAAAWVARELGTKGCRCAVFDQRLPVNFLGLYDAVEMIPSGPFTPGHRLPEWLPGDQGPPDSVPGNVQHFFHARRTGGMFIRSEVPLPVTRFGHPDEIGFPLIKGYRVKRQGIVTLSDHRQIGALPNLTQAHRYMLKAAAAAGIPIDTTNPASHLPGKP